MLDEADSIGATVGSEKVAGRVVELVVVLTVGSVAGSRLLVVNGGTCEICEIAEADGCFVFEQWPLLRGRQVVHDLPAFTHAQFLHFPSLLHWQQTTMTVWQAGVQRYFV